MLSWTAFPQLLAILSHNILEEELVLLHNKKDLPMSIGNLPKIQALIITKNLQILVFMAM